MERQLGYITVVILKAADCAGCPQRLTVGETAIKDHRGYHHPPCYANALRDDYDHVEARKEAQRGRGR